MDNSSNNLTTENKTTLIIGNNLPPQVIKFGYGKLGIGHFQTNGIGRCILIQNRKEVGVIGSNLELINIYDNTFKIGEYYLLFKNIESAKALKNVLDGMIEKEGEWCAMTEDKPE